MKKPPETLISDLPVEDQNAIISQEKKPMKVVAFDEYGHIEMEFTSVDGVMHTIWVEPNDLFKVDVAATK